LWLDENVLPLQILHWLHEMTELWAALEFLHCCRSLLEVSNLRVDEDHLLCLQRLYPDPPDQPTNLAQLGYFWQKLFQQSQCTHNADLSRLCAELAAGMIGSPEHLRLRIEAIATALHSAQTAPPMTSFVPSPEESKASPEVVSSTEITQDLRPVPPSAIGAAQEATGSLQPLADDDDESGLDDQPTVVLAMRLVSLEDAGRTDIGRQRNHNEDCFSVQTEIKKVENLQGRTVQAKGLYILCDGMGGHASGEVASALAVETLQQYFAEHWHDKLPSEENIREAIQRANWVIYNQNQQNASAGSGRMGTTLVLLLIHNTEAAVAHVGDSRLYRFSRRQGLQQLTVDHEVGQREIQRGVEPAIAYARPDAYQLTQALGPRDANFLNPDVKFMELNEDGVLLLCSDGLSDNDLLETHWESHLEPLLDQRTNLEQGVNQLIDLANQYNGHDNISAIAVRVKVRPNLDQKF
jgi:protein phosphatase